MQNRVDGADCNLQSRSVSLAQLMSQVVTKYLTTCQADQCVTDLVLQLVMKQSAVAAVMISVANTTWLLLAHESSVAALGGVAHGQHGIPLLDQELYC